MIISKFYFYIDGGWVYQGSTSDSEWNVSSLDLQYYNIYNWRIDTYDTDNELTTTGDEWEFTTARSYFSNERRSDYNPDLNWDFVDGEYQWTDVMTTGGGRYGKQLLIVGHNVIYYGDLNGNT